eukprot:748935-Prymnesium_polylepis.5
MAGLSSAGPGGSSALRTRLPSCCLSQPRGASLLSASSTDSRQEGAHHEYGEGRQARLIRGPARVTRGPVRPLRPRTVRHRGGAKRQHERIDVLAAVSLGLGVKDLPLVLRQRELVVLERQLPFRPEGEARLAAKVVAQDETVRVLVLVRCPHLKLPLPVGVVKQGQVRYRLGLWIVTAQRLVTNLRTWQAACRSVSFLQVSGLALSVEYMYCSGTGGSYTAYLHVRPVDLQE